MCASWAGGRGPASPPPPSAGDTTRRGSMSTLFDLGGKVAIVTGAGRGLGKTLALGLARHGADVVAVSRTLSQVEQVASEIAALGRKAIALKVDTSSKVDVDRMVAKTLEGWGRIDVLVNNAGIDIMKPAVDYAA